MRFLLASKSPARRSTLISAGITPLVVVSDVDEAAVLAALPHGQALTGRNTTPSEEVLALARAKCMTVVNELTHSTGQDHITRAPLPLDEELVVVGCDSMLELDGEMVGKPNSAEDAQQRIRQMRNTDSTLWTGHYAVRLAPQADGSPHLRHVIGETAGSASTVVSFGSISEDEIAAYIESEEPLHVAGAFTIDGLGGPFIRGVTGDHHGVVGISLPLLREMFIELNIFWPDLWDHRNS